jgi:hypothetical protein
MTNTESANYIYKKYTISAKENASYINKERTSDTISSKETH